MSANIAEKPTKSASYYSSWFEKLTPDIGAHWHAFHDAVQDGGTLDARTKELISVAAASLGRCTHCTQGHIEAAGKAGAGEADIAEAMLVSALIASGAELHWMLDDYQELLGEKKGEGRWFEQRTPDAGRQWREFHDAVYAESRLDRKTKELVAVAAACMGRCPHCTRAHIAEAQKHGASKDEIGEAVMIAALMASGTQLMWAKDSFEELLNH